MKLRLSKTHRNTQLNKDRPHDNNLQYVNFNHKSTRLRPDVESDPGAAAESDPGAQHGSQHADTQNIQNIRKSASYLWLRLHVARSDSARSAVLSSVVMTSLSEFNIQHVTLQRIMKTFCLIHWFNNVRNLWKITVTIIYIPKWMSLNCWFGLTNSPTTQNYKFIAA